MHEGVTCDGCGTRPIVGVRYKCGVCEDFDLCAHCEAAVAHDETHAFLKIRTRKAAPAAIFTCLREGQRSEDEAIHSTGPGVAAASAAPAAPVNPHAVGTGPAAFPCMQPGMQPGAWPDMQTWGDVRKCGRKWFKEAARAHWQQQAAEGAGAEGSGMGPGPCGPGAWGDDWANRPWRGRGRHGCHGGGGGGGHWRRER